MVLTVPSVLLTSGLSLSLQLIGMECLDAYEHHGCVCGYVWLPQPKKDWRADDHCPQCAVLGEPLIRPRFRNPKGSQTRLEPVNVRLPSLCG